jgi:hypothetical protein
MPAKIRDRIEQEMFDRVTTSAKVPWVTTHTGRFEAHKLLAAAGSSGSALLRRYIRYLDEIDRCGLPSSVD